MQILQQSGPITLYKDGLHFGAQHKVLIKPGNGQATVVYTTHDPEKAGRAFEHYCKTPNEPYRGN